MKTWHEHSFVFHPSSFVLPRLIAPAPRPTYTSPAAMRLSIAILIACCLRAGSAVACNGDLDGDGRVTVGELVRCVDGLLGAVPDEECRAAYPGLTIAALVRGVRDALGGCRATATPTPPPPVAATASRTATSCVSEAPYLRAAVADPAQPYLWHVTGRSRVLQLGRGTVWASLDCRQALAVRSLGSQEFALDVPLAHPGAHVVSVCTAPSVCGTAWCRQRRIACDAVACVDGGDLPPVLAADLRCADPP